MARDDQVVALRPPRKRGGRCGRYARTQTALQDGQSRDQSRDWQWWLEWWLALLHAHGPVCAMVGHSGRHWLYQSFCWKQLLGQQHAPCGTPPSTHAPSRPMHVVSGGDGGAGGGVSGASVSGACTCTVCATTCTVCATKSSNAADHGGIGTLRLRTRGSSLHTMGRRVKRRGHSTKGAWCASRLPLCRSGGEPSTPPPQWRRRSGASVPILSPHPLHRRTARQTFPTADRRRQLTSTGRKGGAHREPHARRPAPASSTDQHTGT